MNMKAGNLSSVLDIAIRRVLFAADSLPMLFICYNMALCDSQAVYSVFFAQNMYTVYRIVPN